SIWYFSKNSNNKIVRMIRTNETRARIVSHSLPTTLRHNLIHYLPQTYSLLPILLQSFLLPFLRLALIFHVVFSHGYQQYVNHQKTHPAIVLLINVPDQILSLAMSEGDVVIHIPLVLSSLLVHQP